MRTLLLAGCLLAGGGGAAWALPAVGDVAPAFDALDETGARVTLAGFKGIPVVLYSYPADDTPGCTVEAKQFSAARERLAALGAVVLGVSTQDAASHKAFKEKYGLNFPLLVDPEHKLMKAYGFSSGGAYAARMTVLIGPDGKVAAVWPTVKVQGHDEEVLAALEKLLPKKAAPAPAPAKAAPAPARK